MLWSNLVLVVVIFCTLAEELALRPEGAQAHQVATSRAPTVVGPDNLIQTKLRHLAGLFTSIVQHEEKRIKNMTRSLMDAWGATDLKTHKGYVVNLVGQLVLGSSSGKTPENTLGQLIADLLINFAAVTGDTMPVQELKRIEKLLLDPGQKNLTDKEVRELLQTVETSFAEWDLVRSADQSKTPESRLTREEINALLTALSFATAKCPGYFKRLKDIIEPKGFASDSNLMKFMDNIRLEHETFEANPATNCTLQKS